MNHSEIAFKNGMLHNFKRQNKDLVVGELGKNIEVEGNIIENIEEYKYLGTVIPTKRDTQ